MLLLFIIATSKKFQIFQPISAVNWSLEWNKLNILNISIVILEGTAVAISSIDHT